MLKLKVVKIVKRVAIQLFCCIIVLGTGILFSFLISKYLGIMIMGVIPYTGLFFLFIGFLLSPKGHHTDINLQAAGQRNANLISFQDTEVTRVDQQIAREAKDYYKELYQFRNIKTLFNNIAFIVPGIFMIGYAIYKL